MGLFSKLCRSTPKHKQTFAVKMIEGQDSATSGQSRVSSKLDVDALNYLCVNKVRNETPKMS